MNGIIILNKTASFTSMDCCAIIRKIAQEKKVGHTGTLDPNATGVLPICIGKATRLIEYMDKSTKTYIAGFRLGCTSDTEDIWGNVVKTQNAFFIDRTAVEDAINNFIGEIEQVPPMYSAKKINGQKLYDLARSGKEIKRQACKITIYQCKLLEFDGIDGRLEIECSRGTYVRTLCSDLGKILGCGAVMTSLDRISTGGFSKEDAVSLDEIKANGIERYLLPMECALKDLVRIDIDNNLAVLARNGNPDLYSKLPKQLLKEKFVSLFYDDKLVAIMEDGKLKKVFNENF